MVEDIITYLDLQLSSIGAFQKKWGLVERVVETDKTYPAKYIGGGDYKHVSGLSNYSGSCYWRKNGLVTTNVIEHPRISSKKQIEITIPLKGVFVVRKDNLPNDNEYSNYSLVTQITKVITAKANSLKLTLLASKVDVFETAYEVDSSEVLAGEYVGIEDVSINPKYAYVSIDLNVFVVISRECIPEIC